MNTTDKLQKEIENIDQEKSKIYEAMKDIENAKSLGETIKEELDRLKGMQYGTTLANNQEVITWNRFDERKCPLGKAVLITTKSGMVHIDTLCEDPETGEEKFSKFPIGKPEDLAIAWAEKPKGYNRV